MNRDLKNCTFAQLADLLTALGAKPYLTDYIFSFIHTRNIADTNDISPLPKTLRTELIRQGFHISTLTTVQTFQDPDSTGKYLFEAPDHTRLESVLLTDTAAGGRKTLCISSQAGCRMACRFCATGSLGFSRNLTAAEIVDQVNIIAADTGPINNIVYMGMGEPFDNYDAVLASLHILTDPHGRNIGQRHITVSTCGVPDAIETFAGEHLQVRLAVSLHAPTDDIRRQIVPVSGKYPLARLIESIKHYQQKTRRRVTVEYCMIKDINDSPQHARQLAALIRPLKASVNLIEFNPYEGCPFKSSPQRSIEQFKTVLTDARIETVIRYRRGRSIKAACGQLGADFLSPHRNNHR
jgi:23S rRNA (adenine2503-C2)-methyltransferase